MELTLTLVVAAAIATVVGAVIQGAIGFGINLVTVPVFALIEPEALPVAAILLGLPISITMLLHEHDALDRAGIGWIIVGRIPGTVLGTIIVAGASIAVRQGLTGVFVVLASVASVWAPPVPVRRETQVAGGLVSGVTGTAAGIGGPPLALLYQRQSGPTIRSTLAASFFFGTLLSLALLAIAGEVEWAQIALGAILAPFVIVGSLGGRRFHDQLDRGWIRPAVLLFAAISGVVVILDAIT